MTTDPTQQTQALVERLREQGHPEHAEHLASKLAHSVERGALFGLREACETLLTAIEAIDPVTQTMIEELRLGVEAHLRLSGDKPKPS